MTNVTGAAVNSVNRNTVVVGVTSWVMSVPLVMLAAIPAETTFLAAAGAMIVLAVANIAMLFFNALSRPARPSAPAATSPRPDFPVEVRAYPITVDYSLTLEEMVGAGHYDWIRPEITAEHFPLEGAALVTANALLVHFDRQTLARRARVELGHMGLRPGTIVELLAFGAQHPEVQCQFTIVQIASAWMSSDGRRQVGYIYGIEDERYLSFCSFENNWYARVRFLAFPKF